MSLVEDNEGSGSIEQFINIRLKGFNPFFLSSEEQTINSAVLLLAVNVEN